MSWLKQRPPLLALALVALATAAPGGTAITSNSGCDEGPCPSRLRSTLTPRLEVVAEPVGRLPAAPPMAHVDARLERAAFRVLASERMSGGLSQALGTVRIRAVQIGDLTARGRRLGATMLVDLTEPRRDVWATVPAYVPVEDDSGHPYTPQSVRMHVATLRDALIDIDLAHRRVIAFEPGPRSKSLSWSPSQAPAPAGPGDET